MKRFAAFVVGAVFGLTLSWSGMTNPDVLRDGLLFRDAYLMLFFASALATAFIGLRVLEGAAGAGAADRGAGGLDDGRARSGGTSSGSVLFGVGWAVADACPGPIAAQLGQGVPWASRRRPASCSASGVFLQPPSAGA